MHTDAHPQCNRLFPKKSGVSSGSLIAEFLGSALFQFIGGAAVSNSLATGLATAAIGNGFSYAVLVYATIGIVKAPPSSLLDSVGQHLPGVPSHPQCQQQREHIEHPHTNELQ